MSASGIEVLSRDRKANRLTCTGIARGSGEKERAKDGSTTQAQILFIFMYVLLCTLYVHMYNLSAFFCFFFFFWSLVVCTVQCV